MLGEQTLDVSWDGLAIRARGQARCGESVRVAVRVPRSNFWLHGKGRVTRVIEGRRWSDDGPAFGIRLVEMHGFDRLVWGTALRRHPRTVGLRGETRDYAEAVLRIARDR